MPAKDADPGPAVRLVVRVGDEPHLRRWERVGTTSTFKQVGSMVEFYQDITPPTAWSALGRCFAGTEHPVIAVSRRHGLWVIGDERDAAAQ
jgi:hypothetical protein